MPGIPAKFHNAETPPDPKWIDSVLVQTNLLPLEHLSLITALREDDREDRRPPDESRTNKLLAQGESLLIRAASLLEATKGN